MENIRKKISALPSGGLSRICYCKRVGQQEKELVPRKLCSVWVGFLLCFDFLLL